MKTVFALALVLMLPGCVTGGSLASMALPSIDACEKVNYQREGNKVLIYAECEIKR